MPRFAFGKRKSTAEGENDITPSFRVLDRSEVARGNGKCFDGGARLSTKTHTLPQTTISDLTFEDNIFADYKPNNRGSGSSNTTKTNSTDNSSRHSNASTAPSSADLNGHEDWRSAYKRSLTDAVVTPTSALAPKPNSSGYLRSGGRSWSFGASKKQLPAVPLRDEDAPIIPQIPEQYKSGRARATTTSTDATITPLKLEQDISFDLGGSFSTLFLGFDKRASGTTLMDEDGKQGGLQPSATTGGRPRAHSPIHIDSTSIIESPAHSWTSHPPDEYLPRLKPRVAPPPLENTPPPVPKHGEPLAVRPTGPGHSSSESFSERASAIWSGRRKSPCTNSETGHEADDLDSAFLAVSRYMLDGNSRSATPSAAVGGRYRRDDDTLRTDYKGVHTQSPASNPDAVKDAEDDNLFDNVPLNTVRVDTTHQHRPQLKDVAIPVKNKTMTLSEFEKYRRVKEVEDRRAEHEKSQENGSDDDDDDDDINYDDDEDELERSKQLVRQRRKQEAHMTVYRQQMMKVTGESSDLPPTRPSTQVFASNPNLTVPDSLGKPSSDASEDDEEVPLAILAAHGFPNKNRPPTRLTTMMSNPNLRQAAQPSYQRPASAAGHAQHNGPLPPFARSLPQDPYGLVNAPPRESFALGGGVAAGQTPPLPPGGLVGVIANEERSRALRRASPQIAQMDNFQGMSSQALPTAFDPAAHGIPQMPPLQMMCPQPVTMFSPSEQAQLQLNQQMTQFMQMQMQFMQMMAVNNNQAMTGPPRSAGHMSSNSMATLPAMNNTGMALPVGAMDMNRAARGSSYLGPPMMDSPTGDMQVRTMSMVQPSSASWLQSAPPAGSLSLGLPSSGYVPSIAPSERSNVGLPGRYRPVSQMPPNASGTADHRRKSSVMSGGLGPHSEAHAAKKDFKITVQSAPTIKPTSNEAEADDDDEQGWAAMKAKRDRKKSSWRSKKAPAPGDLNIGSLIT